MCKTYYDVDLRTFGAVTTTFVIGGYTSKYTLRLYSWAKKYVETGTQSISLEELRKVLGLEPVKDAEGNVFQEPPMPKPVPSLPLPSQFASALAAMAPQDLSTQ
jgi:Initiator Replication protein